MHSTRWQRLALMLTVMAAVALWPAATHAQPVGTGTPWAPYLAWAVASDGTPYLLDARYTVWELDAAKLAPIRSSQPLLPAMGRDGAYLAVTDDAVWVGAAALDGSVILARKTLARRAAVEHFGPMAPGPDGEIYLIDGTGLYRYPAEVPGEAPEVLLEPWATGQYYGTRPMQVAVDPVQRRLYLTRYNAFGSPPHNGESLLTSDLTASEWQEIDSSLGRYSLPVTTSDGELMAVAFNAKSGALGSWVGLWRNGIREQAAKLLDGKVALDPGGAWLYLLNDRGIWVFNLPAMNLASVLPVLATAPEEIRVAPDGQTLYLFGRNAYAALGAEAVQSLGMAHLTALPQPDVPGAYRVYPSPTVATDGVTFAVRTNPPGPDPYGVLISSDGRRTWAPVPRLGYLDFAGVDGLSISPSFADDGTVVASGVYTQSLFRSVDGGNAWLPWRPPLAFTRAVDGQREIALRQMDTGEILPVTDHPADDENPAWSPGWTQIAFQSNRSGNWDLYSIRAGCDVIALGEEACGLRQLTDDLADDLLPAWSPDGRQVAFVSLRDGNAEIYVLTLATGDVMRVTDDPGGDWRPAWLPDSRQIIFTSARAGDNDLYVVRIPAPGTTYVPAPQPLVATPADERDPAVSLHNGLLFVSDYAGPPAIFRIDAWNLWDNNAPTLAASPVANPYGLGAQTRHVAGGHAAWDPGGPNLPLFYAREDESNYQILYGDFYSDAPESLVEDRAFVGHPAGGPTFWSGESP